MSKLSARGKDRNIVERESGFLLSAAPAPLPGYDALRDGNLRQYFESRNVQRFLQHKGWVDKTGKIIDLDKYRAKLNIIEQEFKYAEKTEFWRLKEEEEMRRTIQIKRERALTEAKRNERARKIKEENRIRKGIIAAVKNQRRPEEVVVNQHLDLSTSAEASRHKTASSPEADIGQRGGQRRGEADGESGRNNEEKRVVKVEDKDIRKHESSHDREARKQEGIGGIVEEGGTFATQQNVAEDD